MHHHHISINEFDWLIPDWLTPVNPMEATYQLMSDKSMGFLGDEVVELFLRHHTVSVSVGALDHLLEDGVVSELSKVLRHLPEVLEGDES
jgi:hypothetical protein